MQLDPFNPPSFEHEMAVDLLRWNIAHDRAEEIVQASGCTKGDEDYEFQVEDETKRQWEEDIDRMIEKHFSSLNMPEM